MVSAGAEFLGEPGCVGAAFLPALREVVEMGVERTTPPGDLSEQFLGGGGIDVAANRAAPVADGDGLVGVREQARSASARSVAPMVAAFAAQSKQTGRRMVDS